MDKRLPSAESEYLIKMVCDRAEGPSLERCKTCWGTGGCKTGKTEEEWATMLEVRG